MTEITYRHIWKISWPVLISVLVEQLVGLTDTAFLGRVGEVELGASALGGVFFIAMFVICFGFATGTQIIMGRRNGEGAGGAGEGREAIGSVFYHSLVFLVLLSGLVFALTLLFAPSFLHLIVSSEQVYDAVVTYLDWRVYGIFFSSIACLFRAFYVATTRTNVLTINSIIMVGTNILLDYLLIFGKCGLPAMGLAGAALASTISNAVSMLFFVVYTFIKIDLDQYGLNKLSSWNFRLLRRILNVSIWTMIQDFLSCGTWFVFFLAVESLGTFELALTNVIRNVSSVCYMIIAAIGITATSLVSNFMGAEKNNLVQPLLRKSIFLCFFLLTPLLLFILLFPEFVMDIFTSDSQLVAAGRWPLLVLVSSYVFTVPGQMLFRAVAGTGNTRMALRIELVSLIAYVLYVAIAIYHYRVSVAVSWISEHVYQFSILLLSVWYFNHFDWKSRRI